MNYENLVIGILIFLVLIWRLARFIHIKKHYKISDNVIKNKVCNFIVERPNKQWEIRSGNKAKSDNPQLEMGLSFNKGVLYAGVLSYKDEKKEYTLDQLFELLGPLKPASGITIAPRVMKMSKYGYTYIEETTSAKNPETGRQIQIVVKGFEDEQRKNYIYITGLQSEFERKKDEINFILESFRPFDKESLSTA